MIKKKALIFASILLVSFVGSSGGYGGVTVYDFGASWCAPCRGDIIRDNDLQSEFGESVHFVFVDEDVEVAKANAFINSTHPNFEVRYDPSHELANSMGAVNKTPSTVIVGKNGEKEVINGSLSKSALRSKIMSHQ